MKPRSYTDSGIVLARKSLGEADRIIVVYSKNHGRLALLAKGVRRPKSRKRGHVESFNLVEFQAVASRGIDLMTEAEVKEDFKNIKKSLKKVSLAFYICEVVGKTTREHEQNTDIFYLLKDSLARLSEAKELKKLRMEFIEKLLIVLGFWPGGKKLINPDEKLEEVVERGISSLRVGKILAS